MTNLPSSAAALVSPDTSERSLQTNGTISNFTRLCTSRHVNDLRWIAILVIIGFVLGLLCSELIVYQFVVGEFSQDKYRTRPGLEDFRLQRLRLRRSDYEKKVQTIYANTMAQRSVKWKKPQATAAELKERFSQAFGIEVTEAKTA